MLGINDLQAPGGQRRSNDVFMSRQAGSVRDPYFTLRLYQSRFVQPTEEPGEYFWRWQNAEYDAIVDRMAAGGPATRS